MALILNIETSSAICSVCLARDGEFISGREDASGINHASLLTVFIGQLFGEAQLEMEQLDAVAVSAGPGSYTGLRIGVVTAKGLCFSLSKPLIAVDSLQSFALGLEKKISDPNFIYCPTIDARRNEIYFAVFGNDGEEIRASTNTILTHEIPFSIPEGKKIIVGGSGAFKCKNAWQNFPVIYDESVMPSSTHMIPLSEKKFLAARLENVISFEPHYIKPVYITSKERGAVK